MTCTADTVLLGVISRLLENNRATLTRNKLLLDETVDEMRSEVRVLSRTLLHESADQAMRPESAPTTTFE